MITVTNLNDDGPGSLREALAAEGPRLVVFNVAGTIDLKSTLVIRNGDLSITGQTAPGDGITLKNYDMVISGAENVVVRYLRFRPGDTAGAPRDALGVYHYKNILIDHVSASWGSDENLSFYTGTNLTVQNSIISEGLHKFLNSANGHSCGGIWGGTHSTFYRNLFVHNNARNARLGGHQDAPENMDFRNNVIYNWGIAATHGGWNDSTINVVNNYYRPGPATQRPDKFFYIEGLTQLPDRQILDPEHMGKWFVAGNYIAGHPAVTADNWKGAANTLAVQSNVRVENEFDFAPVSTRSAAEAYAYVLANAGARLPALDAVDKRLLDEVKTGTASYGATYGGGRRGIIDSQNDVGGWPKLESGPALIDTDKDGMPDAWETANGLNPQNAADAFNYDTADGYLNIEKYIGMAPKAPYPPAGLKAAAAAESFTRARSL